MAVARAVLSVVALLSAAAYTGAATNCTGSTLKESEVEGAVSLINEARAKVYHGEQPNGESGENLPPSVNLTTVVSTLYRYRKRFRLGYLCEE
ncbi:hypothetical protein OESDEN_08900 [Oesophagostomum dentatum]|uniref:SCP domain-containing protein n=1 Tax=Oesophagostomum dentatum TaxID=61180 RepID=A0A0B1T1X7_OESDE|nr:hypothetical protein OESDEN_08900 [Oesophagostomum dentatum]